MNTLTTMNDYFAQRLLSEKGIMQKLIKQEATNLFSNTKLQHNLNSRDRDDNDLVPLPWNQDGWGIS